MNEYIGILLFSDKADAALDSDSDFRGRAVSMSSMKNARNKAIDELSKGRSNNVS